MWSILNNRKSVKQTDSKCLLSLEVHSPNEEINLNSTGNPNSQSPLFNDSEHRKWVYLWNSSFETTKLFHGKGGWESIRALQIRSDQHNWNCECFLQNRILLQIFQTRRKHRESTTVIGNTLTMLGKAPSSVSRMWGLGELWKSNQDTYWKSVCRITGPMWPFTTSLQSDCQQWHFFPSLRQRLIF